MDNQQNSLQWQHIINLEDSGQQGFYPTECLPSLIKDAVLLYQQYGQQPLPLIASSALANVSLACQALADVARDKLLISPVSLYFIIIANSGERKSAVDKTFSKAIREWQSHKIEQTRPDVAECSIIHQAWLHQKNGLLKQIKKLAIQGENTSHLEQQLKELVAEEPQIPLLPELFLEDITQEAFITQLAHGWPSSSLWSDEGGIVLSSHGMQNNTTKFVATLNRIWDGNSFILHRKTTKSFTVDNRRLTVSLMLQPLILQHMFLYSANFRH